MLKYILKYTLKYMLKYQFKYIYTNLCRSEMLKYMLCKERICPGNLLN